MPATRVTTWRDEIVESALAAYAQRTYEMAQELHRAGATNLAAYWTECGHTADELHALFVAGGAKVADVEPS
jgi:hypothetical protein